MLVENESWSHGGDKISCGQGREKEEQASWGIAPLCQIKMRISGRSKLTKGIAKRQLTPALGIVIPWCRIYKMGCNIFALETSLFFLCLNLRLLPPHRHKSPERCSGRSSTSGWWVGHVCLPVCSAWEGSFGWHFVPADGTPTLECSPAGKGAQLLPLQMEVSPQGAFPARRSREGRSSSSPAGGKFCYWHITHNFRKFGPAWHRPVSWPYVLP